VAGALGKNETALKGLVTNLNRTTGALASERENLSRSIALLGPTVTNGKDAFAALDNALPDIRALALELVPGVKETPATIDASLPFIAQARPLVSKKELGGVVDQLAPTSKSLAELATENLNVLPQADLFAQCVTDYVLPLGDIKVEDGALSTGVENYKEFIYSLVGFNSESMNFDGNGYYVRFQIGGGKYAWATGPYGADNPGGGSKRQWSRTNKVPLGTRPAYPGPGNKPPFVADKPCKDQALPNVNGKPAGPADGTAPGGTPAAPYVPPATQRGTLPKTSDAPVTTDVVSELADRLNPFRGAGEDGR
jgi:hypothetical protein